MEVKIKNSFMEKKLNPNNKFIVYTDGSSRGNPGPGGWSAIIINEDKSEIRNIKYEIKEIGGREKETTNNRMEMTAAIEALKYISSVEQKNKIKKEDFQVGIFTDSEYLLKGITVWIHNWQKNNWRTKDRKDVLNKDLWLLLSEEVEKRGVSWQRVVGHSGDKLNDRCDDIATSFADNKKVSLFNVSKQDYKLFHKS